jgi:NDP-sugar pyrophosphorylase family protein
MIIVIPMAGQGSRFTKAGFDLPKPLIVANGKTLAQHSIESLGIEGQFVFITRTFDNPEHNDMLTKVFEETCKNFIEIRVDGKHLGAAHSASFAEKYIDTDEPLIVTNCDQHLDWDGKKFIEFIENNDPDGAVVLFKSHSTKNSFALISDNKIIALAEKQPISNDALIGVHYWKKASDFFDSARLLLDDFYDQGYPECYVSVTYNYLINAGKYIAPYFVKNEEFSALGTPEDLETFVSK